jgi:hypothetical protein
MISSCAIEGFLGKKNRLFVAFLHFLCNIAFGQVVLMPYDHAAIFFVLPSSPRLRVNGDIRKVVTQRKEDIGCHICPVHVMVELPSLDSVFH